MQQWPQFKEDLLSRTDDVLLCAGLAAHQKIHNDLPPLTQTQGSRTVAQVALVIIRARILGHTPITEIRSLKRGTYGKLVSVRGTVIRVNAPRVICSWLVFRCVKCQGNQAIKSPSGYEIVQPRSCKSRGCTARGNFQPVVDSPFTRSESYQIIRLQESMQHSQTAAGEIPKSIEVELAYDLVDTVCPGDDVTLTGVIQAKSSEGKAQLESLHHFYLQAVSLCNNKNSLAARISDLSESDIEIIEQIRNGPSPLRTFVHSLCPNIFGHDMVKAGLMLALFGGSGTGTKKDVAPENAKRVESHVLVVGDPGVGKSHLLQACANVAPRGKFETALIFESRINSSLFIAGVFVCGNSTTNAGLTATVRHEKGVGGSLEAGALVLADQGVCCIDEFDKMSSNYQALLQAMEQQVVSVAKAGILCALPARTCILAAANPTGGHYDRSRTVAENLKMNPALLSRFDLVFILLDRADAYLDNLLTSHIQSLQTNRRPIASTSRLITATQAPPRAFSYTAKTGTPIAAIDNSLPLFERLRLESNEQINPVPHVIMQKYIGYARKNCFPTLSAEATAELKAFYMELRATRSGIDSIPVTTRQLEALIRLTQARARLDLCNLATVEHAQDVLAILRFSMVDVMSTEQNTLSMRRNINGAGMSQATQAKKFLQALQISGKALLSSDDMKIIASTIGVQANLTNLIDALNVQGFLIKRGHNLYKFNT